MYRRANVKPGPFQLRVLDAVAVAEEPQVPLDVCHTLGMHSKDVKRILLALDRLLHLGYVTEEYPDNIAVYTATEAGRAVATC